MRIAMVVILLMLLAGATASAQQRDIKWTTVPDSIVTEDSLIEFGWLHLPDSETKAPLIVCLPMMGHDHSSFDPFVAAAEKYVNADSTTVPPCFLVLDLRGHGKSVHRGGATISYTDMEAPDFAYLPGDVMAFIQHVLVDSTNNIDVAEVTVIGASIGANTAILLTQIMNDISAVAALSPGLTYRELKPAPALEAFDGRCLIMAEKKDTYAARSSRQLASLREGCELDILQGKAHGTDIINNEPQAMQILVDWVFSD